LAQLKEGLSCRPARESDAPGLAQLHTAVAEDLTNRFGRGRWSYTISEASVRRAIKSSRILIAWSDARIVATLQLGTTKPWAIDRAYFVDVPRALYLQSMAVAPDLQRQGIGSYLIEEAKKAAIAWPANAIRLDAYDATAGAGGFYAKCGFNEVGRLTYRNTPLIYYELLL
jgi:GNAT superfamily N-acetyltransferase